VAEPHVVEPDRGLDDLRRRAFGARFEHLRKLSRELRWQRLHARSVGMP